jgi:hypothetical protein
VIITAAGTMTAVRFHVRVDDHQPLFDQDTGSRLEPSDACTVGVHFIRTDALRIRNGSGDRALHVGDLADVPVAVVAAKDDSDHRLDQPAGCRPRALNLNAVVAAQSGLAALFSPSAVVVLLTIGTQHTRTTRTTAAVTAATTRAVRRPSPRYAQNLLASGA